MILQDCDAGVILQHGPGGVGGQARAGVYSTITGPGELPGGWRLVQRELRAVRELEVLEEPGVWETPVEMLSSQEESVRQTERQ